MTTQTQDYDVIVVGMGIAGCAAALTLAEGSEKCAVIVPSHNTKESNSFWAQGGIIYKSEDDDEEESLINDILVAGANMNDVKAAEKLAHIGPKIVKSMLISQESVSFVDFDTHTRPVSQSESSDETESDTDDDTASNDTDASIDKKQETLSLTLEGSHSKARIIHWRDHTGKAIMNSMTRAVFDNDSIEKLCGYTVIDLVTSHQPSDPNANNRCTGVRIMPSDGSGPARILHAKSVILATGGCGEVFAHTSNPLCARGDGVAMALRAGAIVKNMEFIQFHPTTLYAPGERSFLLTEALRGEGAKLINPVTGEHFAHKYHPKAELAPRDVVSRMIVNEMRTHGCDHVLLDMSHADSAWIQRRFPSIHAHALAQGYDMCIQPLPVVPAAHYSCGGIGVDLNGRSSLEGMYAIGEVSCTGLHGANRLASTSLLEGLVWGVAAAKDHMEASSTLYKPYSGSETEVYEHATWFPNLPPPDYYVDPPTEDWVDETWAILKQLMWTNVGIVRRPRALQEAVVSLTALANNVDARYKLLSKHKDDANDGASDSHSYPGSLIMSVIGLRNAITVGLCIASCASRNTVSTGAHYVEYDIYEAKSEIDPQEPESGASGQRDSPLALGVATPHLHAASVSD